MDQEYGLIQEFTSEVGGMHDQVQDNQAANRNISPSVLVIETEPRFDIDIKSVQNEAQEADPSDSTSTSIMGNLTIAMSGAQAYFGQISKRTKQEVLKRRVICAKWIVARPGLMNVTMITL